MKGEDLLKKEYPGRGLIIGRLGEDLLAVYFLMGRSMSSQSRILEQEGNVIRTRPTDLLELQKGNPDLLIYNAIVYDKDHDFIVVSNGKQTDSIVESLKSAGDQTINSFMNALSNWSFEPDEPHYTPRISAMISQKEALISIIRKENSNAMRPFYLPLFRKSCAGITTYAGDNEHPLKSYDKGEFSIELKGDAKKVSEKVWGLLDHQYRVSLATMIVKEEGVIETHIINRNTID